ncbi:hypothetical protein [Malikia sp.]|uniref:hypothetical protein n=1 Tax=Malikia sp. TaxID=2070706 RepID=UPI0026184114|nr:hypothetical protein [Malikia sp.]MDD2730455.1 hypothetical protein [Malikia sp.]
MKKIALLCAVLVFSAFAGEPEGQEFDGLLTTPGCAAEGSFSSCYLENYSCGSDGCFRKNEPASMKKVPLALWQHNTGKTYIVDVTKLKASELGEGYNRNGVIIVGTLDEATNTIHATEFKAPPPPKKSFFKGCL